MGISNQLKTVDEAFAKIAAIPQLAAKPIVIGENDPEGCAACPGPQNAYRNGTMYSSYTAATYARLWELARRRHVKLEGALTWAFTFVGQPWFAGYRQLATNGVDLPVLNVFRLLARLGPEQVVATSSGELPLEEIVANGVRNTSDVGVLASRTDKGRIDVLLWHYQDDDVSGPSADVHVVLSGLARGTRYQARVWRVDRDNGDAFTAWQAMGSPGEPDEKQTAALVTASKISARSLPLGPVGPGGRVTFQRSLPLQGVELIEVAPKP
jgi:xylan 1,4-beta-xylosidase